MGMNSALEMRRNRLLYTSSASSNNWSIVEVQSGTNNGNITVTFAESLLEDDIVLVLRVADVTSGTIPSPSDGDGYAYLFNDASDIPGATLRWKRMGSTPDIDVDFGALQASVHSTYSVIVIRGADGTTLLDVAIPVVANGTGTTNSYTGITTVTDNCLILAIAMLDDDASAVSTWPTGYDLIQDNASVSGRASHGVSAKVLVSAGLETPDTTVWTTGNDQWGSYTVALRPA